MRSKEDKRIKNLLDYLRQKQINKTNYNEIKEQHVNDWIDVHYSQLKNTQSINFQNALKTWAFQNSLE